MNDPRIDLLARNLTGFSIDLKKGERVLIDAFEVPDEMVVALIRAARAVGAVPLVQTHRGRIAREMARGAQDDALGVQARIQLAQMKSMHAYIALRGGENAMEMSDVPPEKMKLVSKKMKAVLAPTIRLAEEGFPVTEIISRDWAGGEKKLRQSESAVRTYLPNGRAPLTGEILDRKRSCRERVYSCV